MRNDGATQWAFFLLRVVAGLSFMLHGTQKLLGFPPSQSGTTFPLMSFMGFAGVLELVGGLLIALGLLTRPAAFVVAGQMAVAYFMAHAPRGALPILNQGEPAVLYCFIFLLFAAAGAGVYSLDHLIATRKTHADTHDMPTQHTGRVTPSAAG